MELPITLEAVKHVARRLGHLNDEVVFLGGSAVSLLITDPAMLSVRPTMDVDVIVEVESRAKYYVLERDLRRLGFEARVGANEPLCRWTVAGINVDIMPTDTQILGFSNAWYSEAIRNSRRVRLDETVQIRIVHAPYFLATKIEAFRGRGEGDYFASHDIEDIVTVIDGRQELAEEISSASVELRAFISEAFEQFVADTSFVESLSAHLLPDAASQARSTIILKRMDQMVRTGRDI